MNCRICGKPVLLVPTAQQRADKYGGSPRDYVLLFQEHAGCILAKRDRETQELMQILKADEKRVYRDP